MILGGALVLATLVSSSAAKGTPSFPFSNATGSSDETFPTEVGHLGSFKYGKAPFVAQEDRLQSDKWNRESVEMRWEPKDAEKDHATSDDIFRNLGTTSPYHPAYDLFPETFHHRVLPPQCKIKQVHFLHRHGARYPTGTGGPSGFGEKIKAAQKLGTLKVSGDYEFLKHWEYKLGENLLVHKGAQELFDSGVKAYYDYAELLDGYDKKPVIRTTSQSRMVDSARYWALGFFGWDMDKKVNIEVLTEAPLHKSPLSPYYTCPAFFSPKAINVLTWHLKFLKEATKRVQEHVKGVPITSSDVSQMVSLCAYETVSQGYSDFCKLFTKKDFEEFSYENDLKFQTVFGFMSTGGKAMGLGWVQEFLHRLKKEPMKGPWTTQNKKLDEDETYFPIDQPIYADFTHDAVIQTILTTLNMRQVADELSGFHMDENRKYRTSRVVPFGARLVFEVMDCDGTDYIRVKMNDAVVPLDENQGCERRPNGLCQLDSYIKHLEDHAYHDSNYDFLCTLKLNENFDLTKLLEGGILSNDDLKALSKSPYKHHSRMEHIRRAM